jgi:tetratricopeptide (TPR) repeat protein
VVVEEFGTPDAALRWCIDEIATIADAVELATSSGQYRAAVQLPTSMIDFFQTRKHWSAWLGTHQRGVEAARELGDKEREGVLLCGIGAAYRELRQYDLAQDHLDSAAEIARAGNHRFPLARALSALGILAMDQGDNATAVVRFAECAQIAEEDDDPYGAMLAVYNCGYAYMLSEKLDDARAAFEKALTMGHKLQAVDVTTGCVGALAEILRLSGDPEGALVRFREGVVLAVEANDLVGQLAGHDAIARTLIQLGRPDEAKSAYLSALQAAEQLGDPRLPELQTALDQLG